MIFPSVRLSEKHFGFESWVYNCLDACYPSSGPAVAKA